MCCDILRQQSYSLISNVVKASFCHMHSLNADHMVLTLFQALAALEGSVVYDNSMGQAFQSLPPLGGHCSPVRPRNNAH